MSYSIGEVAKMLDLSVPTLRYYDKEGLLPLLERTESGIRKFEDIDIENLKIVECLKASGMPIKDIKVFINWCGEGDASLKQRYEMFLERKAAVEKQIEELEKAKKTIEFKCWYYKTALDAGTEAVHDQLGTKSKTKNN